MAEIRAKTVLKTKGDEAYIAVRQLKVTLTWGAAVDLDLMAFYRAKDGRTGGVFSCNYEGGSMGGLNDFPFIELSADAGVGAKGGDNEEIIRITRLDDMAEVYICAINFTDAVKNKPSSFGSYDGFIGIIGDKGETVAVPLDSTQTGTCAVIARIDNTSFMGAKLINENSILDLSTFQRTIPGAATLIISSKSQEEIKAVKRFLELRKKADTAITRAGLDQQRARVAMAIDVSASMQHLFDKGVVQRACERLLALAVKFDDNGAIDIFIFDNRDHEVGEMHQSGFYGFVDREILVNLQNKIWGSTSYGGVIRRITGKYTDKPGFWASLMGRRPTPQDPAYVLFVTDGDNDDKDDTERAITDASKEAIFWQFVGIGNSSFSFLEKLDTMPGRFIDNANFFKLNDLDKISDEELYDRLLAEFPLWLKLAKDKGLL
ncbi:tellurium resistance protein [Candidatus Magnetobacterium bavaricum]|uniref:Tellurium resistance protein n=1 Tax=Candidatus Magnetobacterium bavaricum TaxID=29290 RepID=A0A0F3GR71_9BACT|nr:tellurium resistance protein [Candidatus Magnetobacterium bavaricum]